LFWQRLFVFIFFSLFCAPFLGLLAGEGGSLAVGVWLWRLAVALGVWRLAFDIWPLAVGPCPLPLLPPLLLPLPLPLPFAFAICSFRFGCMYLFFFVCLLCTSAIFFLLL
jgi:hypothetical protein